MSVKYSLLLLSLVTPLGFAQNIATTQQKPSGLALTTTETSTQIKPAEPANAQPVETQTPESEPPTLLDASLPDDRKLLLANNELLAKNAELNRRVDTLTTQVNVLVQERSGQLYIYGAMTAIFCVILGFVFAKLTTKRRW